MGENDRKFSLIAVGKRKLAQIEFSSLGERDGGLAYLFKYELLLNSAFRSKPISSLQLLRPENSKNTKNYISTRICGTFAISFRFGTLSQSDALKTIADLNPLTSNLCVLAKMNAVMNL